MNGLTFGIDLGIGSCGWAVLRHAAGDSPGEIVALGSWILDVPETDKERTPSNQVRRSHRLLRRVIRRRRQRMAEIRRLFHAHGLLASTDSDALKRAGLDPWELRARALDKPLKPVELAVALGNIAKRRGFKSAAKRKSTNVADDDQKMLKALEGTKERLARYRTFGEMLARDPDFSGRKRNRDGVYDRTASRDDLLREAHAIFAAQRRLGNGLASEPLESSFVNAAFDQRPMQDSERLVGMCPFEPSEKRAARHAPSFEKFRLLCRLAHLRVTSPDGERPLTPDEIARAIADLGKTAKLSAKRVRALIGLADDQRFTAIKPDEEGRDIAARTGEALSGTAALRKALGEELWARLIDAPEKLDAIAHVLSFFETNEKIIEELEKLALDADAIDALSTALEADNRPFARFKGAANISAKVARAAIPLLVQGETYDAAMKAAGYDHAASRWSGREQVANKTQFNDLVKAVGEEIANPIARKSLTEGLKQLWAMRNEWGLPDAIHIELARDVGNSIEKRKEIERRSDDTAKQRDRERDDAAGQLGLTKGEVSSDMLLRYRLWKEQGGRCLYTDTPIAPGEFLSNDYQIDHILPWWRFGDDSFNNKTLCRTSANQDKKDATPCEWISRKAPDAWETFSARVESCKQMRGFKKRNYLLKNAEEREKDFRSRNLNDTRYAARRLADAVKLFYPAGERQEKDGVRRVYTRPGALTSALRHAWGVESLKKINGQRVSDDRHHALDALVVAAVGEGEVQRLTKSYQEWEQRGLGRPLRYVPEPWPGFREQVKTALDQVFVARPERRRARGEGHAATIYSTSEREGETVVCERVAIAKLGMEKSKFSEAKALAQLSRLKDLERNRVIYDSVRRWIENGRPADNLPRSRAGDTIQKLRLATIKKSAVPVRGGTADRTEMVRVDVFTKPNGRGKPEFYYIPIYPHQVMNKRLGIPNDHLARGKPTQPLSSEHEFYLSLYPQSCVEIMDEKQQKHVGYFRGLNTNTISLAVSAHQSNDAKRDGIGGKRLASLKKYQVDRFGRKHEVKKEVRTWHGVACTSPAPAG